jgi:hypothetical protein
MSVNSIIYNYPSTEELSLLRNNRDKVITEMRNQSLLMDDLNDIQRIKMESDICNTFDNFLLPVDNCFIEEEFRNFHI